MKPLLQLAEQWANEAGATLRWRHSSAATAMLTHANPVHRALWRCALELASRVEAASGPGYADLLRDLTLEPVEQDAERPGG